MGPQNTTIRVYSAHGKGAGCGNERRAKILCLLRISRPLYFKQRLCNLFNIVWVLELEVASCREQKLLTLVFYRNASINLTAIGTQRPLRLLSEVFKVLSQTIEKMIFCSAASWNQKASTARILFQKTEEEEEVGVTPCSSHKVPKQLTVSFPSSPLNRHLVR